VTGAGLRRLWRLTVFHPTFVAEVSTFLGLALALRILAVLVHLFLDVTSTLFDLSFNAHDVLLLCRR